MDSVQTVLLTTEEEVTSISSCENHSTRSVSGPLNQHSRCARGHSDIGQSEEFDMPDTELTFDKPTIDVMQNRPITINPKHLFLIS